MIRTVQYRHSIAVPWKRGVLTAFVSGTPPCAIIEDWETGALESVEVSPDHLTFEKRLEDLIKEEQAARSRVAIQPAIPIIGARQ